MKTLLAKAAMSVLASIATLIFDKAIAEENPVAPQEVLNGIISTKELLYVPSFGGPTFHDGSFQHIWATAFLESGQMAGSLQPAQKPQDPKPAEKEAVSKSLSQMVQEQKQAREVFDEQHRDLRNKIFANFKNIADFLTRSGEPAIPVSAKPEASYEPTPEMPSYSFEKFVSCLQGARPFVRSLIYYQSKNLVAQAAELEGLVSHSLADDKGPSTIGMLCGIHLGAASFAVRSWIERLQILELLLPKNGEATQEELSKNILRIAIATMHQRSPVMGNPVWRYIWLRSSQSLASGGELFSPDKLGEEFFASAQKTDFAVDENTTVKMLWKIDDIKKTIAVGEDFARETLP